MGEQATPITSVVVLTEPQLAALIERTWRSAREAEQQNEVMTREEVAEMLRCDPRTIANWVKEKGLPEHSIGRDKRYRRSEILRWVGSL